MHAAVLSGYILAGFAPLLWRLAPRQTGPLLALLPAGILAYFAAAIAEIAAGGDRAVSWSWVPSLGINLSFHLDGLSLLFALLVSGIGVLVFLYAAGYLEGHPFLGRFYAWLLVFMSSMLGLVLADNVITLFVFWELTSLSSYFLIGFDHERESARRAALTALLVTGGGGLALLAGLLMLGSVGGSLEISALCGRGDLVRASSLYLPALLLILAGAFTKSAQFPFHFWLPAAMEAPTPVSAYLHSATMVNAGVYLLARLFPVLGGTDDWHHLLVAVGGITMLVGAAAGIIQTDLKRILAYTTVAALGTLVLLIGIGSRLAMTAALVYLLVHALYKGALFLVAGGVDHAVGTRNVEQLGGLRRSMPITAMAALLAALAMAGIPPLLGFVGKELMYEAGLKDPAGIFIVGVMVCANMLVVAAAGVAGIRPFFGKRSEAGAPGHENPFSLLAGPLILALLGLGAGIVSGMVGRALIHPAVRAVRGGEGEVELALWHGVSGPFLADMLTIAGGIAVYAAWRRLRAWSARTGIGEGAGTGGLFGHAGTLFIRLAGVITRFLQNGYLRHYLMTVLGVVFFLVGYTLVFRAGIRWPAAWPDVRLYEWIPAVVILGAALLAVTTSSRLTAVAALGVVGYGVAVIYILFGAPDLAMTQFCVETLSVILFVLILYRLPRFATFTSKKARIRDVVVSLANGALMTLLVLAATAEPFRSRLSGFFAENSLPGGKGHNIVNVILIDFRGLDTLGEITVLATAALGVFALLKVRNRERRKQ